MRIVFFGASALGYQCCEALLQTGQSVVGIFTIPQTFNISYSKDKPVQNVLYQDFRVLGEEYNIPVIEVIDKMMAYQEQLKALKPDFLLVIGWYYMIPKQMRALASKGCAGIHASLLPKYRGGAPLVWAIINGETQTGVSFFYFDDGVDNGDIIAQTTIDITSDDTIAQVLEKATKASIGLVQHYVPLVALDKAPRRAQDEQLATYFPQRSPEDGLIDWSWDEKKIHNFVRAQTKPYPGAYTIIGNKKVTIWDVKVESWEV